MKDYKVIEAMQSFGGSFAKSIGDALMYADSTNYDRLTKAFPDLMEEYELMANQEVNSNRSEEHTSELQSQD